MVDLVKFRNQVTLIVSNLAKAVVNELFTAEVTLDSKNPGNEEKLGALVEHLCEGAVNRILKVLESGENFQTPGADSEVAVAPRAPTGQTFILVYENAAVKSKTACANNAKGERAMDADCSSFSMAEHDYALPAAKRKQIRGNASEPHHCCPRCSRLFPSAERLQEHLRRSHHTCSVCAASFSGVQDLRRHELTEHGSMPFACQFCGKTFNHKAHRDVHVKARHTGQRDFACDACEKSYCSASALKTHRLTHSDKNFVCDKCGKAFHRAGHLTRHKLLHRDDKPHGCATCGKGFRQVANLRSHQRTHAAERQLCSVCGRRFRHLENHLISKHSHELPPSAGFPCQLCKKKFPTAWLQRAHARRCSRD